MLNKYILISILLFIIFEEINSTFEAKLFFMLSSSYLSIIFMNNS